MIVALGLIALAFAISTAVCAVGWQRTRRRSVIRGRGLEAIARAVTFDELKSAIEGMAPGSSCVFTQSIPAAQDGLVLIRDSHQQVVGTLRGRDGQPSNFLERLASLAGIALERLIIEQQWRENAIHMELAEKAAGFGT